VIWRGGCSIVTAGPEGRVHPRCEPLPLSTKRDATSRLASISLSNASRKIISALSQKISLASSATAVKAGIVRTKRRKSRLGTPSVSAARDMLPHDSANTRFASSIEIFSQLGGSLGAGYRGIDLAPDLSLESDEYTLGAMPTHYSLGSAQ
jgi:hypothetical protein